VTIALDELCGRAVTFEEAAAAVAAGVASSFGIELCTDAPAPAELDRAATLERERYGDVRWTAER
jgi:hypothetical protein